jgi:hypothetical protein
MIYIPDERILASMYRIPMVQPTDCKKFNKKKVAREDVSIPLTRRNKIIMGSEGGRDLDRKRGRGGQKGGKIRYGGRQERSPEGQENE